MLGQRSNEVTPEDALWNEDHSRAQRWIADNLGRNAAMSDTNVDSLYAVLKEVRLDAIEKIASARRDLDNPNNGASPPSPLGNNEIRECWCHECLDAPEHGFNNPTARTMILCPACGNKRCPRATDHRFACTGSNEPGQFGSNYGQRIDSAKGVPFAKPIPVCAYCGQAEGHSRRCSVTKFGAPEMPVKPARKARVSEPNKLACADCQTYCDCARDP